MQRLKEITHEQAVEFGTKGGKSTSLRKQLTNRLYCNADCPLYDKCWAKHTSTALYEKELRESDIKSMSKKEKEKLKPKCALKGAPSQVIDRTLRFIMQGEKGFYDEMVENLTRFGNDVLIDPSPAKRERYHNLLLTTHKAMFGDKSRTEVKIESNMLKASNFAEAYNEFKKKKVPNEK